MGRGPGLESRRRGPLLAFAPCQCAQRAGKEKNGLSPTLGISSEISFFWKENKLMRANKRLCR